MNGASSGSMQYVKIEFAGRQVNVDDELAGLALQGVGNGTVIENIHIHRSAGDGIEFFGGRVNARWLIMTGVQGDSLDWTFGWQGRVQYVIAQHYVGSAEYGVSGQNNGESARGDATPRSDPILSNLTLVGSADSDGAIQLSEGTGGQIWNAVATNFTAPALDIDDRETFVHAQQARLNLTVAHSVLCNSTNFADDGEAFAVGNFYSQGTAFGSVNNTALMPPCTLGFSTDLTSATTPNFVPAPVEVLEMGQTPADPFFTATTFRGAIAPGDAMPWYAWTSF